MFHTIFLLNLLCNSVENSENRENNEQLFDTLLLLFDLCFYVTVTCISK